MPSKVWSSALVDEAGSGAAGSSLAVRQRFGGRSTGRGWTIGMGRGISIASLGFSRSGTIATSSTVCSGVSGSGGTLSTPGTRRATSHPPKLRLHSTAAIVTPSGPPRDVAFQRSVIVRSYFIEVPPTTPRTDACRTFSTLVICRAHAGELWPEPGAIRGDVPALCNSHHMLFTTFALRSLIDLSCARNREHPR